MNWKALIAIPFVSLGVAVLVAFERVLACAVFASAYHGVYSVLHGPHIEGAGGWFPAMTALVVAGGMALTYLVFVSFDAEHESEFRRPLVGDLCVVVTLLAYWVS